MTAGPITTPATRPAPRSDPGPAQGPTPGKPSAAALAVVATVLALLWGTAYTLVAVGVRELEPVWLVSLRCIVGAGLVTGYALVRGNRFPPIRDRRWLWFGMLGQIGVTVPFVMVAFAQVRVPSGLTAILLGVIPVLTVVIAHLAGTERLSRRGLLGFVLGFVGIVVLFLPKELTLSLVDTWRSQLLLVGAAAFYATTTVTASQSPPTPSAVGAAIMLLSAAASATIAGLVMGLPASEITAREWLVVVALGAGSTATGTILYLWAASRGGAGFVAKINYWPPVVSVVAGVAFLKEVVDWRLGVALALIALGMWISRPSRP